MKNISATAGIYILLFTAISIFTFTACTQAKAEKSTTFKVYGNCGMCKETIEGALEKDGIYFADWNKETKIIEIQYDSTKYTLVQLHSMIANAGYDTETEKAPDEAYNGLHECCQYERPM